MCRSAIAAPWSAAFATLTRRPRCRCCLYSWTALWSRPARWERATSRPRIFSNLSSPPAARQDEIVIEARLPVLPEGAGFAFDEVTRRHGDYALVGVGCVLSLDGSGRAQNIRLAACGISDRPVRLKAAEAALDGSLLAAGDLAAAARASADAVTQTDDMNTSMSYRRRVLSGLIQRLVPIAASRARGGKRQ